MSYSRQIIIQDSYKSYINENLEPFIKQLINYIDKQEIQVDINYLELRLETDFDRKLTKDEINDIKERLKGLKVIKNVLRYFDF